MTHFTAAWIWTLFRSVLLIGLALPWCGLLVRWISGSRGWRRSLQWGLLSVPFLFPELLTGYAYGQMTRLLITGPWIRELWFDLLLFLRVVPIGTLLWYCSPPSPLSREAIHARKLAFPPLDSPLKRFCVMTWYQLHGPARTAIFAGCGLFLAVFQEFELASLLAVSSWTVWLFDAQAEGLPIGNSLQYVALPAFFTWIICGSLPWAFLGARRTSAALSSQKKSLPAWVQAGLWCYLGLACVLIGIYPLSLIGFEGAQGILALVNNPIQLRGLVEGILIAGGSALVVAMLTDLVAEGLLKRLPPRGWRSVALLGISLGLCGSLAISLVMLSVFQLPWLITLRDTTQPTLCGLFVWLLPRAVVLQGIRRTLRSPISEHAATLLAVAPDGPRRAAARHLQWLIRDRVQFASRVLLFHWAYWDLTIPSLLNPAGLVTAPVRLYIDAHFSRNALLTAKAGVTMLVPVVFLIVILGLIRIWHAILQSMNRE